MTRDWPIRVSIVATPDAMAAPVSGLFETFRLVGPLAVAEGDAPPGTAPFDVEIVGRFAGEMRSASADATQAASRCADRRPFVARYGAMTSSGMSRSPVSTSSRRSWPTSRYWQT